MSGLLFTIGLLVTTAVLFGLVIFYNKMNEPILEHDSQMTPEVEKLRTIIEDHTGVGVYRCWVAGGVWFVNCQLGIMKLEELLKLGRIHLKA